VELAEAVLEVDLLLLHDLLVLRRRVVDHLASRR
jgi:hypothetical protein